MAEMETNNRTFNLLSDILKMVGEYTPDDIQNALKHLKNTSKGQYQDIMTTLLKSLETLNNLPSASPSQQTDSSSEKPSSRKDKPLSTGKKKPVKAKGKAVLKDDTKIVEFREMLENKVFITSKKDVVKIIEKYFKDLVTLRTDNKDSKRDLISKVMSQYKKMKSAQREKVYSAIKRSYLRKQK